MKVAKAVRSVIFWSHLCVAVVIGVVVFVMSVTGAMLAYERELLGRPAPSLQSAPRGAARGAAQGAGQGAGQGAAQDAPRDASQDAPQGAPQNGAAQRRGDAAPPTPARAFFSAVERVHRSLSLTMTRRGDKPGMGRTIARVSNVAFLFLVLSGIYLWFPRRWSKLAVRRTALFHRGARGRYRDWNWHHVFGFWTALPLLLIVGSATLMSYQAPRIVIERVFGMPVESALQPPGGGAERSAGDRVPGEQPAGDRVRGDRGGRNRADGERSSSERPRAPVDPTIRKFRFWIRGIHTGQAGGFIGETIAAIASLAAAGLVLTGLSLTIRRFWRKFRPASATVA